VHPLDTVEESGTNNAALQRKGVRPLDIDVTHVFSSTLLDMISDWLFLVSERWSGSTGDRLLKNSSQSESPASPHDPSSESRGHVKSDSLLISSMYDPMDGHDVVRRTPRAAMASASSLELLNSKNVLWMLSFTWHVW